MSSWVLPGCIAFGMAIAMLIAMFAHAREIAELRRRIATLEDDIDQFPLAAINANGEVYRTHIKRTWEA